MSEEKKHLDPAYFNTDGTFKDGFDGCVRYMQSDKGGGHSEESAKKICGKIAAMKGKDTLVVALCGISTSAAAVSGLSSSVSAPRDRWLVYVPKGDRKVPQKNPDGSPYELRVHPTPLSAKRMEGARRKMMSEGGVKPYTDYDHKDEDASGAPLRFAWHDDFGVIGLTRLTAKAVERTTGEPPEYQSFSPHVPMDPETGEAVGLYANCGGFVNRGLFGAEALLSATARLSASLVAADPNDVAQISAALDGGETNTAAQGEKQMKELKAKLCAAWQLDPEKATEAELIAAFEKQQAGVTALTAMAALGNEAVVVLGFDAKQPPKVGELKAKVDGLTKPPANVIELRAHASEVADIAVRAGIISPAEKEITIARLTGSARGDEFKALVAKQPTVPIGTVVNTNTSEGANGLGPQADAWEAPLKELVAKDAELSKIAAADMNKARSMGLVRLMGEKPELFKTEGK
jgi:hypothetical protein